MLVVFNTVLSMYEINDIYKVHMDNSKAQTIIKLYLYT